MIKVKIYTIGRCKDSWLQEALAEYEKRLSGTAEIEWILTKNEKELAAKVQKPWIALDVKGVLLDSVALSKKLAIQGSRINFLIGGADGIAPELLAASAWQWSLSPLTFTHQMTRLILLEQLYRAIEIKAGTGYHR